MLFLDIVFPLNLPPLTYRCPDSLADLALPGTLVAAPLRNRIAQGIILRKASGAPGGKARDLTRLISDKPVVSRPLLALLEWMAEYYIAPEGIVMKYTLPDELFPISRPSRPKPEEIPPGDFTPLDIPEKDLAPLIAAMKSNGYSTFLLRSSARYQYSLALRLACSGHRCLIIFPEIRRAESFYAAIRGLTGDRACLLHSTMTTGRRRSVVSGIVDNRYEVVVGTRAALFAPFDRPGVIMVVDEGSGSYKVDDGFRYNTRDVAVMRGFLEKTVVLLTASAPSVDSAANAMTGKYRTLSPSSDSARPRITMIDERREKKIGPGITQTVFQAAQIALKKGRKVLFIMNRKGYAPLISCSECGHAEECPDCRIPIVLYKGAAGRCGYCGRSFPVPDNCSRCGGHHLELLGAGTERIQETLDAIPGIDSVRIDRDAAGSKTELNRLLQALSGDSVNVAIGTKMLTKNLGIGNTFDMAAVLNADAALSQPDFRAAEKAYMELSSVIDLVKPSGEVYIQTRSPRSDLFRSVKNGRHADFVQEELALRKTLNYPPYARMLGIHHRGDLRLSDKIVRTVSAAAPQVEALGPAASKDRRGREEQIVLLRDRDRKVLNAAARAVLENCGKEEAAELTIDVDPS